MNLLKTHIHKVFTSLDLIVQFVLFLNIVMFPLGIVFEYQPGWFEGVLDLGTSVALFLYSIDRYRKEQEGKSWAGRVWMTLRAVATVPVLLAMMAFGLNEWASSVFLGLHLLIVPEMLYVFFQSRKNKLVSKHIKIVTILYGVVVGIHYISCGWLLIRPPNADLDWGSAYNLGAYWTVTTLTTVGYGDITPSNNLERVYTMLAMVLGVGVYGLVISQMSNFMLKSDRRKETTQSKLEDLSSLFYHYEVPPELQDDIFSFYQHMLAQNVNDNEKRIISELPPALQAALQVHMAIKPLSQVSLFEGCTLGCLKAAAYKMEQVVFGPGETIISKGEVGEEMYILNHGLVSVHDGKFHIAQLDKGKCFGELALVYSVPRSADVTATSYCDLMRLTKDRFQELVDEYPELRKNVEAVIQNYTKAS